MKLPRFSLLKGIRSTIPHNILNIICTINASNSSWNNNGNLEDFNESTLLKFGTSLYDRRNIAIDESVLKKFLINILVSATLDVRRKMCITPRVRAS